ncbi:uncharacterized protein (DUF1800 family) [Pseudoduganella flava]|uniref:DUF1800 family protein n=1 Tax=Pseudoduganella flava TaxID=871742 RepID=A0A562PVA5_9BURK|nr:DUF1800 domain-containing protein [Pseudoduganella flava]QGZ39466.1 DUF1800 family protein [Pseudoduganella flava]TWI48349.1 uncharacterized protein (DUF1800 family) [Pseudoduganella flava]
MRILLALCLMLTQLSLAAAPLEGEAAAAHVLNRLAYGPRPGDVARVAGMGVQRYVDEQLNPQALQLPPALDERLRALSTQQEAAGVTLARFLDARKAGGEMQRSVNAQLGAEAAEARVLRAVDSPRQLEEVMTEFWFNHFNVFAGKGEVRALAASFERDAIRPHVFGRFRDLLGATAHHPAMLFYLDNWLSKAGGLNENYARELMELHTLGVDGGYTQRDVTELARMVTGWTFRPQKLARDGELFYFDPKRHDQGDKTWLGKPVEGRGKADSMREGEIALDILAMHPSTARHVSTKLARHFVRDVPPPALVERMTRTWMLSDGDIRAGLRTLFASPEFLDAGVAGAKFKTPYQYVVSAARAAAVTPDVKRMAGALARLGMPVYGCQTPDGYDDTQEAWLNPDALGIRIGIAATLGKEADAQVLEQALGTLLSPRTRDLAAAGPPKLRAALLLGSPDFMQR